MGIVTIMARMYVSSVMLLLASVYCYDVRLTKRSTIYLPHSYFPNGTGHYGLYGGAVEQMSYDHDHKIIYTVGGTVLHAINMSDPDNMRILSYLEYPGMEFTDVEFCGGHIFTALDNKTDRANGKVVILNVTSMTELMQIPVGAVPDMLMPTSDCSKLVVAVEGEAYESSPNQITDPPGLVVIITFPDGISDNYNIVSLNFNKFNDKVDELSKCGVRHVFQEDNNPFSNDVEPETITMNPDNTIAYVALQENNAVAVVDLLQQNITGIYGLGFKNWSQSTLDPSDRDNGAFMYPYSVMGMYQPDLIVHFAFNGDNYLIMANEGDSKDYQSWSEEKRASDVSSNILPDMDAATREQINDDKLLGRLKVSVSPAGMDTSGRLKALYTFGGRSFSIRRADDMSLVYDSGDDISSKTFQHRHALFNSLIHIDDVNARPFENFDSRSDDKKLCLGITILASLLSVQARKGPETEVVAVGTIDGVTLLFIANECPGTILVYSLDSDISKPVFHDIYDGIPDTRSKTWAQLYEERLLSEIDAEDLRFVPASKSPTGRPVLLAVGAVTGTVSIINVDVTPTQPTTPVKPCTSSVMRSGDGSSVVTLAIIALSLSLMRT